MKRFVLGLGLLSLSFTASADFLGLTTNRTANIASHPQMTVEGGLNMGGDANIIGGQVGYKFAPNTLLIGSLGTLDADGYGDDIVFGGGVIHQLSESFIPNLEMAVKGTFNTWSYGSGSTDVDYTEIGVELVMSPVEQNVIQGAEVFGFVGFHKLDIDVSTTVIFLGQNIGGKSSVSDTELSFGAGALMPVGNGQAYGTIEFIDGVSFGLGYRIALGQ